jgi:hypothetical protein
MTEPPDDFDPSDQGLSPPREGGLSRNTDPETSHAAGDSIAGMRIGILQGAVLAVVKAHPGSFASAIFAWVCALFQEAGRTLSAPIYRDSITPRLSELREKGLVENEPKGSPHRTTIDPETGRAVLRWWEKGESPSAKAAAANASKPQAELFPRDPARFTE